MLKLAGGGRAESLRAPSGARPEAVTRTTEAKGQDACPCGWVSGSSSSTKALRPERSEGAY